VRRRIINLRKKEESSAKSAVSSEAASYAPSGEDMNFNLDGLFETLLER
jgi:hypothetical protein